MKVIILAGGYGTRLSEYTDVIPKPMVEIGTRPIIWHIMNRYALYGHSDFILALGYKADVIRHYFLNYSTVNSNFTVDLRSGEVIAHSNSSVDWRVTLVDTGLHSMTGGRLRRLKDYVAGERILLTYGDGVADIDLDKLCASHERSGKMVTLTAVRPSARFGELDLDDDDNVRNFEEKPQLHDGWINGGFFVIEPEFFDYVSDDATVLEREPLNRLVNEGELHAYKHPGFWQCMDTKRDREALEAVYRSGSAPWLTRA